MRIVLIRATEVMPDPPVEKMANTLISHGHRETSLAWDRSNTYAERGSIKKLANSETEIVHFGIPAKYSGGIKANFKGLLLFQMRIIRWLFRHRREYDAVHAFDFDTGFASMICCKLLRKKLIYHVLDYYAEGHILPGRLLNSIIEFFEIRVINSANATVICTEKRKEQIRKASPRKLYVIHNTPDSVQQMDTSFQVNGCTGKLKLVYVGVLSRMRLLKETVEVVSKMDDVEMHIGGFGEYEDWMQKAAEQYSNVFFYGKLQYSETLALEKQCDIMMAVYDPSIRNHKYAAPNKFYESIMLGKPIIMAYDTGHDDIITKNDIGILTEYSESGIRDAIYALEKRRNEWNDMGKRAMNLYNSNYSWTIMTERIEEMYRNL